MPVKYYYKCLKCSNFFLDVFDQKKCSHCGHFGIEKAWEVKTRIFKWDRLIVGTFHETKFNRSTMQQSGMLVNEFEYCYGRGSTKCLQPACATVRPDGAHEIIPISGSKMKRKRAK